MPFTLEAKIDEKGNVTILQPVAVTGTRRALVVVLDEPALGFENTDDILSEAELQAEDQVWQENQARHAAKFAELKAQAESEIAAGKTLDMFDENGEFALK